MHDSAFRPQNKFPARATEGCFRKQESLAIELMNVHVARDGEELGECDRSELEQLAREGEIKPSDHYWHDGMTDWLLLGDLLGAQAWEPLPAKLEPEPELKPEPAPAVEVTEPVEVPKLVEEKVTEPPPVVRQNRWSWISAAILAILVFAAVTFYFARPAPLKPLTHNASTPVPAPPPKLLSVAENPKKEEPAQTNSKEKAIADLRQRIERLPARATPPLNTFYYDVSLELLPLNPEDSTWTGTIRGSENVIAPATGETVKRTEFVINANYQDGQWVFKHYHASITNMADSSIAQTEHDEDTPMPPSLVGILGLKMNYH